MLHSKFWQAFFALAPLFGFVLIFIGYGVFMFSIFGNMEQMQHSGQPPAEFFSGMGFFFFMIFLMVVLALASLIFYIVHAAQNPNLKQNNLLIYFISITPIRIIVYTDFLRSIFGHQYIIDYIRTVFG